MIDNIFLWVIAWFNPLLDRTGVDTMQLNLILRTKLLIDKRRPKAMFAGRNRKNSTTTGTSWRTVITTLIFGSLYGIVLFIFKKPLVGQTIYFSAFMVLMSLTLITDFTNVLIDVRDQYIIAPRPVNDRTVAIARILHISIYVLRLALIQGLPGIIMIGFADGPAAVPLFFIQIILATLLSIFFVNIVYLFLMRSVSPQRFKDIINYFQIAFTILIFVAYRLLPQLISMSAIENFELLNHTWAYFLAPVWVAALNEALLHASRAGLVTILLAVLGLVLPFISIWFVASVLAPGFNKSLAIIAISDGSQGVQSKQVKKAGFVDKVANLLAPDPIENAGFRITWKLAARTREFKTKVYPQFAFMPVTFVYFILTNSHNNENKFESIQHGKSYIFLLYLCVMILATILQNVAQTEKYKAAWVYYALPIDKPGKILAGMYKAITALYVVPFYIVLSIVAIAIWGPGVINDVVLAFFIIEVYGILMALFLVKGLPFSRPVLTKARGGKAMISLLITGVAGLFGFGHYLLSGWEILIWILILPAALCYWLMLRYYSKQTWDNIEINEID